MGLKSLFVHYKNKYPKGRVVMSDNSLDVYQGDEHVLAIRKNGAGMFEDASASMGLKDRHCLSPIPKDARAYKLYKNGSIGKAEEFKSRHPKGVELAEKHGGRVPSEDELKAAAEQEAQKA